MFRQWLKVMGFKLRTTITSEGNYTRFFALEDTLP